MKKIRTLFDTPKKAAVSIACVVGILAVLGIGTVFAAGTIAESSSIGKVNAQNFAFADAGVDPVSAEAVHTEFDFEHGQFVYEVEFYADGVEYDYWIKASDGAVVKKESSIVGTGGAVPAPGGSTVVDEDPAGTAAPDTAPDGSVTLEEAKKIALADAGVTESEATFTKTQRDLDDGVAVYEIDLYTASVEYDYEIDAATGAIRSREEEPRMSQSGNGDMGNAGSDTGSSGNIGNSGDTGSSGNTGNSSNGSGGNMGSSGNNYIELEQARSIAVAHAGFSVSDPDITFKKAKLDHDDGYTVYEIEFYKGGMEYEYKINALTGDILEYDSEWDD